MCKTLIQIWIQHLLYKKGFQNLNKSVINELPKCTYHLFTLNWPQVCLLEIIWPPINTFLITSHLPITVDPNHCLWDHKCSVRIIKCITKKFKHQVKLCTIFKIFNFLSKGISMLSLSSISAFLIPSLTANTLSYDVTMHAVHFGGQGRVYVPVTLCTPEK